MKPSINIGVRTPSSPICFSGHIKNINTGVRSSQALVNPQESIWASQMLSYILKDKVRKGIMEQKQHSFPKRIADVQSQKGKSWVR